jgi:hypothetical protein
VVDNNDSLRETVRNQLNPAANVVGSFGLGESGMIPGYMSQHQGERMPIHRDVVG